MIRRNKSEAMAELWKRLFLAPRENLEALIAGEFTDNATRDMAQRVLNDRTSAIKAMAEKRRVKC